VGGVYRSEREGQACRISGTCGLAVSSSLRAQPDRTSLVLASVIPGASALHILVNLHMDSVSNSQVVPEGQWRTAGINLGADVDSYSLELPRCFRS
jgi:hypothetical protein